MKAFTLLNPHIPSTALFIYKGVTILPITSPKVLGMSSRDQIEVFPNKYYYQQHLAMEKEEKRKWLEEMERKEKLANGEFLITQSLEAAAAANTSSNINLISSNSLFGNNETQDEQNGQDGIKIRIKCKTGEDVKLIVLSVRL